MSARDIQLRAVQTGVLLGGTMVVTEYDAPDGTIMARETRTTDGVYHMMVWYSAELPGLTFDTLDQLITMRRKVPASVRRKAAEGYPRLRDRPSAISATPCGCCHPSERHLARRAWTVRIARCWRRERDITIALCLNHLAEYRDDIPALCALVQCP